MKKRVLVSILAVMASVASLMAQQVSIDASASTIKWTAKKVSGEHTGAINVKSGSLNLKKGNITGGEFLVDMTSITNADLPAGEWHDKLIGHLNSDDFFGTAKFPESKLVITSASAFDKTGQSVVKGLLTIKGITNLIEFTATAEGKAYKATLTVDRTKYGIKYGSGQFFEGLGDKMIMDQFTLDVVLATK